MALIGSLHPWPTPGREGAGDGQSWAGPEKWRGQTTPFTHTLSSSWESAACPQSAFGLALNFHYPFRQHRPNSQRKKDEFLMQNRICLNQAQDSFLTFMRKGEELSGQETRGPARCGGMEVVGMSVFRLERKAWERALGIRVGLLGEELGEWRPFITVLTLIVQPPFILPEAPLTCQNWVGGWWFPAS